MNQTTQLTRRHFECMSIVNDLTSGGWPARVKDIAARLNVRPPTAVEFLLKLTETGLIQKGPSGYRLTDKGTEELKKATRTHRLMETLLTKAGIPLEEACKISHSLGVEMENKTVEALCSHLSHPDTCPHGQPIPAGDEYD
jgi:DtxR family Mn-dependent transcriptional regulator